MKTWLITGASRSIGLEVARAAFAAGDHVVATARNPAGFAGAVGGDESRILAVALDVTDALSITSGVDAALARFGGIDVSSTTPATASSSPSRNCRRTRSSGSSGRMSSVSST